MHLKKACITSTAGEASTGRNSTQTGTIRIKADVSVHINGCIHV